MSLGDRVFLILLKGTRQLGQSALSPFLDQVWMHPKQKVCPWMQGGVREQTIPKPKRRVGRQAGETFKAVLHSKS